MASKKHPDVGPEQWFSSIQHDHPMWERAAQETEVKRGMAEEHEYKIQQTPEVGPFGELVPYAEEHFQTVTPPAQTGAYIPPATHLNPYYHGASYYYQTGVPHVQPPMSPDQSYHARQQ